MREGRKELLNTEFVDDGEPKKHFRFLVVDTFIPHIDEARERQEQTQIRRSSDETCR